MSEETTILSDVLDQLPNGTLLQNGKELHVVSGGLDGRILQDTSNGSWTFLSRLATLKPRRKYQILFQPAEK